MVLGDRSGKRAVKKFTAIVPLFSQVYYGLSERLITNVILVRFCSTQNLKNVALLHDNVRPISVTSKEICIPRKDDYVENAKLLYYGLVPVETKTLDVFLFCVPVAIVGTTSVMLH